MAIERPAKRRRTEQHVAQLEERQIININVGAPVSIAVSPNSANIYIASSAVGDVPSDFTFPAIQFTSTPVVQNTIIPVVTTIVAVPTVYVPAVAPAPAPTRPAVFVPGVATMSTQLRQGTTTIEAQQGQPSIGLLAPKQNATDKMDQWTARVLIIAGSIAGALILLFIVLIIHRWRQGKKPFSRLFSWSKANDDEEEDDLKPYDTTIPQFDPVDPRFSTYQKPIWEVNSSMSSLPRKPSLTYNSDSATGPGALPFHKRAMPSQSRFPPPNKIKNSSPMAEPRFLFSNGPTVTKGDTQVIFKEVSGGSSSETSFEVTIEGPLTDELKDSSGKTSYDSERKLLEKDSKFSWTNTNVPRSPPQTGMRTLSLTSTSAPIYMEVDGWVGQQTNRLVEYQIQQLFDDALEGRNNAADQSLSPRAPAPVAAAVMPLYVPENYTAQALTRMVDLSGANNNPNQNLVNEPSAQWQTAAPRPKGVAATSLYADLAQGRYQ